MNKKVIYFLIYLIIISLQNRRYIFWLPTIPIYPNNKKEVSIVERYSRENNKNQYNFFKLTDESVSYAFNFVNLSEKKIRKIIVEQNYLIVTLKYFFNRARPHQVSDLVIKQKSNTDKTPAYPSGHAFQAYYLASKLSKLYPHLEKRLWETADKCALCRVYAGLHYPSDNLFSKMLVKKYFN